MKWYEKQKKIYEEENTTAHSTSSKENDKTATDEYYDEGFIVEGDIQDEGISSHETLGDVSCDCATSLEPKVLTSTTISEHTQLHGDIQMDGCLNIHGTILGNIDCSGDVTVYGDVQGNILCTNAVIVNASIVGNMTCKNHISIQGNSTIQGDIIAKDLLSEGSIVGSLSIHSCITLTSSARVEGNISTQSFETQKGAVIKGQITTIEEDIHTA